jgi:hypothetical protein
MECSNCDASFKTRITLDVPDDADYDLYAYSTCGTLWASSIGGTGATEQITLTKSDNYGSTDDFDVWVEVRYYYGASCGSWTLTVEGRNC